MSTKVPIIKIFNWFAMIPQIAIMAIVITAWYFFYPRESFLFGGITYIIISFSLRSLIPKAHLQGMKLVKSEKFEEAIPFFQKSYDFFNENIFLDKYRFVTLLSSSKMAYREMALVNIAFCYSQIGNGKKSREYYNRTLEEFPDNPLAKVGLNMLNSVNPKEGHL